MGKREPASRQTKERILEAALAVFTERGYRAASIDEIAARAGVTKGAVYYWFVDKDDLARDLHARLWDRLTQEGLQAVEPDDDVLVSIERGFAAFLRALERLTTARFFLRDTYGDPAVGGTARSVTDEARSVLQALLEEGIRRGEIVPLDPSAMAHVLIGVFAEATLHILTTGAQEPTTDVVRHLVRSLSVPGRGRRAPRKPEAARA